MDNTINSLVSKAVGYTDQQVKDYFLSNPNLTDAQIFSAMKTFGVSPSQIASATGTPLKNIMARLSPLLPQNEAVLLGDTWVQAQYRTTGSGESQEIGPLEQIFVSKTTGGVGDKQPVGTPVDQYSPTGDFLGTIKTQKEKSFFGGLLDAFKDPVVLAAIGGAAYSGLLGGTSLGSLASAAADADIAGGLIPEFGTNAAYDSFINSAMTPAAISSLAATVAANPEVIGSGNLLTNAAAGLPPIVTPPGGAPSVVTPPAATPPAGTPPAGTPPAVVTPPATIPSGVIPLTTGLVASTLGNLAGATVNAQGIEDARNLINQYGTQAGTTLTNAYGDAKGLNATNLAALGTNYGNLNTNLNAALGVQTGAYNTANQAIGTNATNQLGMLGSNYANQVAQSGANAANLGTNYNTALKNLGDIYGQQVGYQQPYQNVGQAGAAGLTANMPYLTRQFGASDLNEQLAPNYAFQLQQGQMANQRAANMGGGSLGGNALQGLQRYTQDYASGAYQNAFNNFNTQRNNIYSTLSGMAGIGNTSAAQLAGLGNTLGGNIGALSSSLGGNLTSNTANLLNAGTAYGTNTAGVTNNLNNIYSSNLGQLQGAYNQYGSNLTGAANAYGGNLTTAAGQGINAANVYGLNAANLATGIGSALASNATASGANTATALSNLGNTALLGSMIKAT